MELLREDMRGDPALLIGKTLKLLGVKRVYTICGGHISPFLKGCEGEGIAVISGRDERSLAYAASIEAALTGFPGTVICTAGPGLAYTFGAVKNAHYKGMPMVVLSGTTATSLKGRGALQDSDQMADMQRYTKCRMRITRARDIPEALARLYEEALKGVPGPVYGELAMDASYPRSLVEKWYADAIKGQSPLIKWFARQRVERLQGLPPNVLIPGFRNHSFDSVSDDGVAYVAEWLRSAEQPVILLGGQIAWSPDRDSINGAIMALGIPCYVNDLARGVVCGENPLLFSRSRSTALREADRILLAGIPPDFRLSYGMWGGGIPRKAEVIRVDRMPQYLRRNLRAKRVFKTDPGRFLSAITKRMPRGCSVGQTVWARRLRMLEQKKIAQDTTRMAEEEKKNTTTIHPIRLGRILEAFLASRRDRRRIVIGDGGDFTAIVARELKSYDAWLDAGPFGSLGGGGGFALAASMVEPGACIVVVFGDGAFGYSAMEYHTLVAQHSGVIGVVGNNCSWEQISRSDMETYGESTAATVLPDAQYEHIVNALGGYGVAVRTADSFKFALEDAAVYARSGHPTLINAYISSTGARAGSLAV